MRFVQTRIFKAIMVTLIIGSVVILSVSCTGNAASTSTPKSQIATVQRGNIAIQVTGTGNLALEYKQELSFGQTGQANNATTSKISEVDVTAGQIVEQGQVLVKADPKDWQDQVTQYKHALDSANNALLRAKNTLTNDQISLQNLQNTLSQVNDVQLIQQEKNDANTQLQQAKLMLQQAQNSNDTNGFNYWNGLVTYYSICTQTDRNGNPLPLNQSAVANGARPAYDGGLLGVYDKQMKDLLSDPVNYLASGAMGTSAPTGFDTLASTAKTILDTQTKIQQAQMTLQQDQSAITLAQNNVDDAQTNLDNEKAAPQEIDAPFKGLITKIWIDSNGNILAPGDIVARNTSLIEIANPDKFVANIMVTEGDVMSVKVGGDATVSLDALQGLSFPAKITQIAPLSTTSQGVVNYKVTVELTSTQPVFPNRSTQGSVPASGGTSSTGAAPSPSRTFSGTPRAGLAQSITLKDGLSATVNIPVQEKDNVLMLPSRAINRQGRTTTVQVVKGTGTEAQTVQIGLTDGTNTEITNGLNEGDQVMIQSITATPRGGFGGPGGGMVIR